MKHAVLVLLLFAVGPQRAPAIDIPALETRIHTLVNAERQTAKLGSLQPEQSLGKAARRHSADMAKRSFFNHINPDRQDPTERARVAGFVCRKQRGNVITQGVAENIAMSPQASRFTTRGSQTTYDWKTAETIAVETVKGWMASEGHRRNILDGSYTLTGIGVAVDDVEKKVYLTQVFC
jgi:uncharacterized protein YkwD